MRITLNLATRPFADLGPAIKRLRIAIGVLALVVLCEAFGLHLFHRKAEEARARDHSLDGQIAQITQERQRYQDMMHEPANVLVVKQADALNKLFELKTFSWTLAMEDLETVLPGGVQVSTLEPVQEKGGRIVLHLRVIGPRDRALELVRNLEHSRRFLLPRIVSENSEAAAAGPSQHLEPVSASNRFNIDLLADFNVASMAEKRPATKAEGARLPKQNATPKPVKPQPAAPANAAAAPVTIGPGIQPPHNRPAYGTIGPISHKPPTAGGPR
jgi:type IV pilus assembly protein PilN